MEVVIDRAKFSPQKINVDVIKLMRVDVWILEGIMVICTCCISAKIEAK